MPLMTVTEAAATKIKQLMSEEEDVSVLRVAIQGGGCSGFQYGLGFDRGAVEGDHEFEVHGVQVVVDPFSAPYLAGRRDRLRRLDPGRRVRDQQPERRLIVRLRPLLPGRRGRRRRQRRRLRLRLLGVAKASLSLRVGTALRAKRGGQSPPLFGTAGRGPRAVAASPSPHA